MSITILLIDDHKILRQGVRTLLAREPDMAVLAEAKTKRQIAETRMVIPKTVETHRG